MALIKCCECGKEISDKAAVCVNCGCPVSETISKNKADATLKSIMDDLLPDSGQLNPSTGQQIPASSPFPTQASTPVQSPAPFAAPVATTPATTPTAAPAAPKATSATKAASGPTISSAEAVAAIKAYQPNQFVQFLKSRRFWSLALIYVGAVIYLLFEDGLYMASAGAAGMAPFFLPIIIAHVLYPFRHIRKYFESEGIDDAIRRGDSMNPAIAAYNAMPTKKMLSYIKTLNASVGTELERQIAAKKAAK